MSRAITSIVMSTSDTVAGCVSTHAVHNVTVYRCCYQATAAGSRERSFPLLATFPSIEMVGAACVTMTNTFLIDTYDPPGILLSQNCCHLLCLISGLSNCCHKATFSSVLSDISAGCTGKDGSQCDNTANKGGKFVTLHLKSTFKARLT